MRNSNESSLDDFVDVKEDLLPMEDVQEGVKVDNSIQDCLDETSIEVTKKETPVHKMQVDIVALLNDMKSLQEEFKSTKSDIEAMIDSKFEKTIPAILEDMKALKRNVTLRDATIISSIRNDLEALKDEATFTKADIKAMKEPISSRDVKIESAVVAVGAEERQRRMEFALTHAESHPLLECDSYQVLEVHHFYRISLIGYPATWDYIGDFDCRQFISVALSMFRINSGIPFPTDVVYSRSRKKGERPSWLLMDEQDAKRRQFQTTIVNFFHSLLEIKPRIEKDETGKLMMFYE
jgi:hypothetical protein